MISFTNAPRFLSQIWGHHWSYSASIKYSAKSPRSYFLLCKCLHSALPCYTFSHRRPLSGHRQLNLLSQSPCSAASYSQMSSSGTRVPADTHSFPLLLPPGPGPPAWLCLQEMHSCTNRSPTQQVLVQVYFWKEFDAESFFKEIILPGICAFL